MKHTAKQNKRVEQSSFSFALLSENMNGSKHNRPNAADPSSKYIVEKFTNISDVVSQCMEHQKMLLKGDFSILDAIKGELHFLVAKFKESNQLYQDIELINNTLKLVLSFKTMMTSEHWDSLDLSIRKSVQMILDSLLQMKYDFVGVPIKFWKKLLSNLLDEITDGDRLDSLAAVHFFHTIYTNVGDVHQFVHEMIAQKFLECIEEAKSLDNILELIDKIFYNSIDSDSSLLEFFLRSIVFVFLKASNIANYSEIFISYLDLILSIDSTLIYSIVQFLLRFWPRTDTSKSTSSIIPLCEWFYIRTQDYPHLQQPIYDLINELSQTHRNSIIRELCQQYIQKANTFSKQK